MLPNMQPYLGVALQEGAVHTCLPPYSPDPATLGVALQEGARLRGCLQPYSPYPATIYIGVALQEGARLRGGADLLPLP